MVPNPLRVVAGVASLVVAMSWSVVTAQDFIKVSQTISEEINKNGAPGAAIAIVKDGQRIFSRAYGQADHGAGRQMGPDELFRSASTLKMMVGAALAELDVRGRLDLHAPVSNYIEGLHPAIGAVTSHQLLTHSSGIVDAGGQGFQSVDALLREMQALDEGDIFLEPDVAFSYSNPGFRLAGLVLESVIDKPFSEAINEVLFKPLGMNRSTFDLDRARALGLTSPHRSENGQFYTLEHRNVGRGEEPSGTMFSTVNDYALFLAEFLKAYAYEEHSGVLSHSTARTMSETQLERGHPVTSYSYSYGLMVGKVAGYDALFHTGGMPGYASNVLMIPSEGLGVVFFTNGENINRNRVLESVIHSILPELEAPPSRWTREDYVKVGSDVGDKLIGTYMQREDLPQIVVSKHGEDYVLRNRGRDYILHQNPDGELIGLTEEGYFHQYRFGYDESGRASHIQWWIRAFARKRD